MAATIDVPVSVKRGPWLLTIEEFEAIPDSVFPEGERFELIEGLIYEKMSQNDPHITALRAVDAALRETFGQGFNLSMQLPLKLGENSKPEPDVTVGGALTRSSTFRSSSR